MQSGSNHHHNAPLPSVAEKRHQSRRSTSNASKDYYFDVETDGMSYVDDYGVKLSSLDDARREGFQLAAALVDEWDMIEDHWSATITIRDEERQPVFVIQCNIDGHDLRNAKACSQT